MHNLTTQQIFLYNVLQRVQAHASGLLNKIDKLLVSKSLKAQRMYEWAWSELTYWFISILWYNFRSLKALISFILSSLVWQNFGIVCTLMFFSPQPMFFPSSPKSISSTSPLATICWVFRQYAVEVCQSIKKCFGLFAAH